MKKFIAYFDYLGFKQFIENNDSIGQRKVMEFNFRDIESALSLGKTKEASRGVIGDLSESNINCINFSDTIVFWTNDDSEKALIELLQVAYKFNWTTNDFTFPARGSLVYGEIEYVEFLERNAGVYNINSVYGLGLVQAHGKAEGQHWAGTVIDETVIQEIRSRGHDPEKFLMPYAKLYKVPYKVEQYPREEYVMRLIEDDLNEETFNNHKNVIIRNFGEHGKISDSKDVQEKIANTIDFLKSFLI